MTHRVCLWPLEVSVIPVVQAIGLVASSWSDKQHFHLPPGGTCPAIISSQGKGRISEFQTTHMTLQSGRPFERAYTMSLHQRAVLQLALENLQSRKRGELRQELIFWSHSKFLFWPTAPTSQPEWGWAQVHWFSRWSRVTSTPCCTQHLLPAPCPCWAVVVVPSPHPLGPTSMATSICRGCSECSPHPSHTCQPETCVPTPRMCQEQGRVWPVLPGCHVHCLSPRWMTAQDLTLRAAPPS